MWKQNIFTKWKNKYIFGNKIYMLMCYKKVEFWYLTKCLCKETNAYTYYCYIKAIWKVYLESRSKVTFLAFISASIAHDHLAFSILWHSLVDQNPKCLGKIGIVADGFKKFNTTAF